MFGHLFSKNIVAEHMRAWGATATGHDIFLICIFLFASIFGADLSLRGHDHTVAPRIYR